MPQKFVSSFTTKIFLGASLLIGLAACASTPSETPATSARFSAPSLTRADILGKDAKALDGLLGAAALSRKEGAGEFRRYALKECSLIVVLYPDEEGRAKVTHIDASADASGEDKPSLDACLAAGG